jgi:hypothetical protein
MGQAASAARWTVEQRTDQLLGLPGNAFLEPAVQPVRLQLLRSLDPAVKTHLTRRPLRRLIGGAGVAHLPVVAPIRPVTVCQQHGAPWATMRKSPKSCQSRALLWGNGDVALDAISARLDRWSGERGCACRRHAGGPRRNGFGRRAREHPHGRGARAGAADGPHSGRRGTGAPGTSQPCTASASPSPS